MVKNLRINLQKMKKSDSLTIENFHRRWGEKNISYSNRLYRDYFLWGLEITGTEDSLPTSEIRARSSTCFQNIPRSRYSMYDTIHDPSKVENGRLVQIYTFNKHLLLVLTKELSRSSVEVQPLKF